ncbi:MAG: hypothetical protein WCL24_12680 [Verrucomicrobiota bacterium]
MSTRTVTVPRLALIVLTCLVLSVTFFAPRLWLMRHEVPGSFQWDRARTYLAQCAQPGRRDIEAAMHWRLLPPLVCHALRLPGYTPLALPWLGVIAVTAYAAVLFRRRLDDWRYVAGGTLLFATTSAVLVPVGWLGINDAWVWLGLLAVAFGRAPWATPLACLLGPWIDERFLIGFPLAWLAGRHERGLDWDWSALREGLWLLPYVGVRLGLSRIDGAASAATQQFLAVQFQQGLRLAPLAPLGWWMGLRAAWLPVAYTAGTTPPGRRLLATLTLLGTLLLTLILASDLSRSIVILLPVVLLGCFQYARRVPLLAPSVLLALGIANLLIPAAHLTYLHIDPINPLPIELLRFLRPA